MKIVPKRGVTAPKGFKAAGLVCGIKASGKKDLGLVVSEAPAAVAAAFTTNRVAAAPVAVCKQNLGDSAQAVIVNSGNANACTGAKGLIDAQAMIELTAVHLGLDLSKVLIASTGVIGKPLPMTQIKQGIGRLRPENGEAADHDLAQAIMTTDAFLKQLAVEVQLSGGPVWIGAAAKGAGMIEPKLKPHATMLAVVTTDAPIKKTELNRNLIAALATSFNAITVDGDTSTNDTVFLLANGMAGDFNLTAQDKRTFQEALDYVCLQLAKMIVRDGEGATKVVGYKVVGAKTKAEAMKVAKSAANSLLVKTAMFGRDPNWGRILAAVGRSGAEINPDDLDVDINGIPVVRSGQAAEFDQSALDAQMRADELQVWINLNQGSYQAIAYGCDLGYDYVKLNAEYRT